MESGLPWDVLRQRIEEFLHLREEASRRSLLLGLETYLPRIVGRVAGSFPQQNCRDDVMEFLRSVAAQWVIERIEAGTLCLEKLAHGANSFDSFLNVGLRRRAIDWLRRNREVATMQWERFVNESPTSLQGQLAADELEDNLRRMRRALNGMAGKTSGQVNYYVVVLLRLRCGFLYRLVVDFEPDEIVLATAAAAAEAHLPWSEHESAQRIKNGLPELGDVWQHLFDCAKVDRLRDDLLKILGINGDLWMQWKKRSKDVVQASVGEDEWSELFEPLLSIRAL